MLIKRSAFLFLTTALAHQACITESATEDGGEGGDNSTGATGATASGGAGEGGAGSGDGGAASGEAGAEAGGASAEAGAGGASQAGAGGVGGAAEGGAGGEGGAGMCDDTVGDPGLCSEACTDELSEAWCDSFATNLEPSVAEAALDCFATDTNCDGFNYECVADALADACPDPFQDLFCADAVIACNPAEVITEEDCHAMVDGLNDSGTAQIYSCVEAGCTFGLWSCVESLI